jgi:hypothetical protein
LEELSEAKGISPTFSKSMVKGIGVFQKFVKTKQNEVKLSLLDRTRQTPILNTVLVFPISCLKQTFNIFLNSFEIRKNLNIFEISKKFCIVLIPFKFSEYKVFKR